jgi:type I restriction enzyme, R subunit
VSTESTPSANFRFLRQHSELMLQVAAQAERYVFDDPNVSLIKLRQLTELLAQDAAARTGIYVDAEENQLGLLNRLYERGILDGKVSQLFHSIRKAGNVAVHQPQQSTQRDALHHLRIGRELAVWFHRAFGNQPNFKAGPFVPPPDPQAAGKELSEELERLRKQVHQERQKAAEAALTAEEEAELRQLAEDEARQLYEEIEAAVALASETEAQLQEVRQQFNEELAQLQTDATAEPAETEKLVQTARQEAEHVNIDEQTTRRLIDEQLREAGWDVDSEALRYANGTRPSKGRNLAIAEVPTKTGPADYVLYAGLMPIAVVEAKRQNADVAGAIGQAKRYSRGFSVDSSSTSPGGPWGEYAIPFLFSTNGRPYLKQLQEKSGVWFLDARQETNHPRSLESWYTPEGLTGLLEQNESEADERLEREPTDYLPLRHYQAAAVRATEARIATGQRELLVAMATGTGKTVTCLSLIYRLIKTKRFRRVLFLVDRSSLGHQTHDALTTFRLENLQTFGDIYDVKSLGDLKPDADTKLHIATVQGMVKRLLYPTEDTEPIPVDWYDCLVIDECHRGYSLDQQMTDGELLFRDEADYISKYRRVIEHFDAVKVGLTATPALHTKEIFGPPIYEYSYRQAVVDGWLVDHEPPFNLVTKLSQDGIKWKRGEVIQTFNSKSKQLQLFNTPDEVKVKVDAFNRKVITENFNRTVCQALAEQIDPSLPGKTLIFCVTDDHAQLVERLMKEAFDSVYGPVHDDTVKKITGASDKPLELIRRFRNEQLPKVVTTVDLLTTGIDIPSIDRLVFIRRVRSRILFEQMLGRATRLCPELYGTGEDKTRFQVYDAVRIYEALESMSSMRPVVARPNITYTQLAKELKEVADEEFLQYVKEQFIAKLNRKKLTDRQEELLVAETGKTCRKVLEHIRQLSPTRLTEWLGQHPAVVRILDERTDDGTDYLVSGHEDEIIRIERGYGKASKPEDYIESFRRFITENADSIPALVVVTQRPRDLTRAQLRELRLLLDQEGFTEANLRAAWRETTNQDIAASIVGYIRSVVLEQPLIAHAERVQAAMKEIITSRSWTDPQRKWLERIGKQLEQEVIVDREAFESGQFKAMGGFGRLNKVFKGELEEILRNISDAMWQAA